MRLKIQTKRKSRINNNNSSKIYNNNEISNINKQYMNRLYI